MIRLIIKLTLLALLAGNSVSASEQVEAAIKERLRGVFPDMPIHQITPSAVPGLYEVVAEGKVFYMDESGRFMLHGQVIDLVDRRNLTEQRQTRIRADLLAGLDEKTLLVYSPEKMAYQVNVFTDIDCGYCRKLHAQRDEYNKLGIEIRYLFFPRSGVDSPSGEKAVSVWCSKDRHAAMTQAKQGGTLKVASCDNPVKDHVQLGGQFGVRGTPALLLSNGEMLPGYIPPDQLLEILKNKSL